jgi:hypothetical protein
MLGFTLIAAISGAILYFRDRELRSERPYIGTIAVIVVALFFATPLSSIIWSNFPLLARIQFPFRWMSLFTLAAALLIGAGFTPMVAALRTSMRPIGLLAMGLLLLPVSFTAFQIIRPAIHVPGNNFESSIASFRKSESCECWWPIWANRSAFGNRADISVGDRTANVKEWEATKRIFTIGEGTGSTARVGSFYYPHWTASDKGTILQTRPENDGTILIELPEGPATVVLEFREPISVRIAQYISIFVFGFAILFIVFDRVHESIRSRQMKK